MSAQVNGEKSHSQTLDHITNYRLASDFINIYQQNPLGAKSISVFHQLYATFAEPLFPYLKTPYSILAPYLEHADNLGDNALSKVDERFPAIKKTDLNTLKTHAFDAAGYPLKIAGEGKEYVLATYDEEYKKTGGQGLVTTGKAVLSTELRIAIETVQKVQAWMGPKKEEANEELDKMKKLGSEKMNKAKKGAEQKKGELVDGK